MKAREVVGANGYSPDCASNNSVVFVGPARFGALKCPPDGVRHFDLEDRLLVCEGVDKCGQ